MAELAVGERHEAPVARPRPVVDVHEGADLGLEVAPAHPPQPDAVLGLQAIGELVDDGEHLVAVGRHDLPLVEVHRLDQPLALK